MQHPRPPKGIDHKQVSHIYIGYAISKTPQRYRPQAGLIYIYWICNIQDPQKGLPAITLVRPPKCLRCLPCSSRVEASLGPPWLYSWLYLDAEVWILPPVFLPQDSVFVGCRLRRHPTPAHPGFFCCVGVACPARGICHFPRRFLACFYKSIYRLNAYTCYLLIYLLASPRETESPSLAGVSRSSAELGGWGG